MKIHAVHAVFDLVIVLWHTLIHGDLAGCLDAWWHVVTGDITPDTRFTVVGYD